MTARFSTVTGRTLVLSVAVSLAAVGCSSKTTTPAASGPGTTAATPPATSTPPSTTAAPVVSDTSSPAAPGGGDGCTATKLGYPVIKDFKGVKIGFSQSEDDTAAFRKAETQSMKDEVKALTGGDVLYTNAKSDAATQIANIKDLITKGAQLLIVAPLNTDGLQPAWDAAKAAHIPVVTVDRQVNAKPCTDYLTFIGSNFVSQGERAAVAMAKALNNKGNVAILMGGAGNSVATQRNDGFIKKLKEIAPDIKISVQQTANWNRAEGQKVAADLLQKDPTITGFYAHNDEMGVGAHAAIKEAGKKPGVDIKIVSIDGIHDAVSLITTDEYTAVIESNPRFGKLALQALQDFEAGTPVPASIIIKDGDYLDKAAATANLANAF